MTIIIISPMYTNPQSSRPRRTSAPVLSISHGRNSWVAMSRSSMGQLLRGNCTPRSGFGEDVRIPQEEREVAFLVTHASGPAVFYQ